MARNRSITFSVMANTSACFICRSEYMIPAAGKSSIQNHEPGKVSMYVCGVTVYDNCHLGHARCYLAFDLIHRWLESSG